jgi:hypothetical protein
MKVEIVSPSQAALAALPEIAALLPLVFQRKKPWLDELRWLYLDNPQGRAWWVNTRDDDGRLVAHSGLFALPPLDDPRFARLPVWFSVLTIVHPEARQPGLMILGLRALLQQLAAAQPSLVLGVANAKSMVGFTRLLRFESLGRLSLQFFPPGRLPPSGVPRAVRLDEDFVRWRISRPGADTYASRERGAVLRRITHHGVPLDGVLSVDLPAQWLAKLAFRPRVLGWWPAAPRLYATFGPGAEAGFAVPERLRPSQLNYICRSLAPDVDAAALSRFLLERRFEFIDFDVM